MDRMRGSRARGYPLHKSSRPQAKRRRETRQDSLTRGFSIDEAVCQKLVADSTSDENSTSEEGLITCRKRRTLKSGLEHMGATQVKKRINCPHEGVFTADGKPACVVSVIVKKAAHSYIN